MAAAFPFRMPQPGGAVRQNEYQDNSQGEYQGHREANHAPPVNQDVYSAYGPQNGAGASAPPGQYAQPQYAQGPRQQQMYPGQAAPSGTDIGAGPPPQQGRVYGAQHGPPEPGYHQQQQQYAANQPPPAYGRTNNAPIQHNESHEQTDAEAKWNKDVRRGFTRKVLFIVFCQLLVTTGVSLLFYLVDPIRDYILQNQWLVIVSWALGFAMLIAMSCSTKLRRRYPYNYLFLFAFTLVFSFMVGAITARYEVQAIGIALAVTCATVFGAFFVAAFTKLDLTKFGGILVAILFGVILMAILAIFWRNPWFYFVIAIVAAVLFTLFLIYDLQLLMGRGARALDPDEYIFAAVNIYLDIIQIFLNVLQIVGFLSN